MNTNKKTWTFALPVAAAALFATMSQSEPARAGDFTQLTGPVLTLNGGIAVKDDAMQDIADMMNQAARDELARQSRTPSIDPTILGQISKVSGNIFH